LGASPKVKTAQAASRQWPVSYPAGIYLKLRVSKQLFGTYGGYDVTAFFVFGFDIAEASQIRRNRLFQDAGFAVFSAAMRRDNMNHDFRPE
jgi:hypothetical protein